MWAMISSTCHRLCCTSHVPLGHQVRAVEGHLARSGITDGAVLCVECINRGGSVSCHELVAFQDGSRRVGVPRLRFGKGASARSRAENGTHAGIKCHLWIKRIEVRDRICSKLGTVRDRQPTEALYILGRGKIIATSLRK